MSDSFAYDYTKVSEELCVREEVLRRLVNSFAQTLTEKIKTLDGAFEKNVVSTVRAIMHEVRGTGGNLRLQEILETAKVFHEAVKADAPHEESEGYFQTFKAKANEFIDFIAKQGSA